VHLDRSAKIAIAGVRARLRAERRVELEGLRTEIAAIRATDAAELARFANEIETLRNEMRADRRELAEARAELRPAMTPEDLEVIDEAHYIVDIVTSLQRATQFAGPLAIAVGLTRVARALGASTSESRTYLALEMARTAIELDPDIAVVRWN
jgi:hypothetical protein